MKLVVATPLYPPESGGPATYAKVLLEGLPSHGIEVVIAKFSDVRAYPKGLSHFLYFLKLLRHGAKADALLALDPVSTGLPCMLAAQVLKKPFVVKIVGDYAWEQGTQRFGITASLDSFVREHDVPAAVKALRRTQVRVAMRAASVIVPSEYLKRIVEAWGVSGEKITVINNAVASSEEGTVPEILERLPAPRFISVGRLVPWKGMRGLVLAMKEARERVSSASLAVVGDGPERAKLEKLAADALPEAHAFTGRLTNADTLAALGASRALILNSTYEGFSHLILEALAAGVPVIATAVGGNPELITDGENGFLVASGDRAALAAAIVRIARDDAVHERLARGALASSARFSKERMLTATAALLLNYV